MTFIGAVYLAYMKIFDFRSRATRAEYWYFQLFLICCAAFIWALQFSIAIFPYVPVISLLVIVLLSIFVQISLTVRRFHDLDKSGWWSLIQFIPYVGWLLIIYFTIQRGTAGPNRFGYSPVYEVRTRQKKSDMVLGLDDIYTLPAMEDKMLRAAFDEALEARRYDEMRTILIDAGLKPNDAYKFINSIRQ